MTFIGSSGKSEKQEEQSLGKRWNYVNPKLKFLGRHVPGVGGILQKEQRLK
jgi:hypothetical protein